MATLTLNGVSPELDGEYPFDEGYLTNRELHIIKQICGLTAGQLEDALEARDNDVNVALAVVALYRAGKTSKTPWNSPQVDALWDAPVGTMVLSFDGDDEEPGELPPTTGNGAAADVLSSDDATGATSNVTSGSQGSILSVTGEPT